MVRYGLNMDRYGEIEEKGRKGGGERSVENTRGVESWKERKKGMEEIYNYWQTDRQNGKHH